jgi:hypothetical protein
MIERTSHIIRAMATGCRLLVEFDGGCVLVGKNPPFMLIKPEQVRTLIDTRQICEWKRDNQGEVSGWADAQSWPNAPIAGWPGDKGTLYRLMQ